MWEEPCISGERGSGTVFFSGCNLRCVYCQNHDIAAGIKGKDISTERLAEIFLELQDKGAHNINLVTPTHYYPQIKEALETAKRDNKLHIPVISNTSSYESVETLREMNGLINIYLADFKYMNSELAKKYSFAENYPDVAKAAFEEMFKQVGAPEYDDAGMLKKGIIARHLMLPGCIKDSKAVIEYLYKTYGDQIILSIMNQYTPLPHVAGYPELNRKVSKMEYNRLTDYAVSIGVKNAFIQEGETQSDSFIPDFNFEGVVSDC